MTPLKLREKPSSPIEAEAISLLRSVGRYEPPVGAKQRVRMRLLESARPHRGTAIRPFLVVAIILVAVGASAAWGQRWFARRAVMTAAATTAHAAPMPAAPVTEVVHDVRGTTSVSPVEEPRAEPAAMGVPSVEPSNRSDAPGRTDGATHTAPPSERALVFDAMRALRREGQPVRAAKLLDEYLRSYPKGLLTEEALALAIEAATASGDPRAKNFADRYLSSYPEGRFRAAAARARARFSR